MDIHSIVENVLVVGSVVFAEQLQCGLGERIDPFAEDDGTRSGVLDEED